MAIDLDFADALASSDSRVLTSSLAGNKQTLFCQCLLIAARA